MVIGTLKTLFGTQMCLTLLQLHLSSRALHALAASFSTTTTALALWLVGKKTKPMPSTLWHSNFRALVPLSMASLCKCTSRWVIAPLWSKASRKTSSGSVHSDLRCTLASSISPAASGSLMLLSHINVRSGATLRRRLKSRNTCRLHRFASMKKRPVPISKSGDSATKTAGSTFSMMQVISTLSFSTTSTILSLPATASFKSSQATQQRCALRQC